VRLLRRGRRGGRVRDVSTGGDGAETRSVDGRRLVGRQYLKGCPHLRDRVERLGDGHEAAGVQSRHQRGVLSANDAAHNLNDHGVTWFKKTLRTLHDGDPLFESPKKRTELREVGYSK